MFQKWFWLAAPVAALAVLSLLAGCGGGSGGSDDGGGVGTTGIARIAITDQSGYDSVVVALREIRLVPAGDEGEGTAGLPVVATYDPPRVVDIMTLSYEQLLLGEAPVPAGDYSQVRLVLASNDGAAPVNYVTLTGDPDTQIALRTPSGQQSGLKIVGDFSIAAGVTSTILLDFDPARAIVVTGNGRYQFKPTGIRLTQIVEVEPTYGALAGTIAPAAAWPAAQIEAIPEGATEAAAIGTPDAVDGTFRLAVPAGVYSLKVTAAGYATLDTAALTPPQVFTVTEGQDTAVGELTLTAAP